MRKKLKKKDNLRETFYGTFERFGIKNSFGYQKETVLLLNIKDKNGNFVADHLWFNKTKGFEQAKLEKGNIVEFQARVKEYIKGYVDSKNYVDDRTVDYKLSYPTKIKIVR